MKMPRKWVVPVNFKPLWFLLFALCWFAVSRVRAQSPSGNGSATHGRKAIAAIRVELPVVVDGSIDEPAWQDAPVSGEFLQREPQEGAAASERTEFRVLYTATTLYIGVICYDSSPQAVLATERRRDDSLDNDDSISLVLDTFHDHRNSYRFKTNPLGAQNDALITDEGRNVNQNWDEKWDVAARIHDAGWTAEFAIPFKSLSFPATGTVWGFNVARYIQRKLEDHRWSGAFHSVTVP